MLFCCSPYIASLLGFQQHFPEVVPVFPVLSLSLLPILCSFFKAKSLIFWKGLIPESLLLSTCNSLQFFSWRAAQTVSFSVKHHPPVLCTPSNFAFAFAAQKQDEVFIMNCHCGVQDSHWSFPYYYFPEFSVPAQIPRTPLLFTLEWHKENLLMKSKSIFKLLRCMMGSISDCISCSPPVTAESHSWGTIISFLEKKVQPRYHRLSCASCPRGAWGFTLYMRLGVTTDMTRNNWVHWILWSLLI